MPTTPTRPTLPGAITPRRLWIALAAVALIAFAGCAAGALDCAVFKPLGLTAALGAAALSLLDNERPLRHEPAPVEESLPGPGRR